MPRHKKGSKIGQTNRSGKSFATGKRKQAKVVVELHNNDAVSSESNETFVTPPTKRNRVLKDTTNSTNNTATATSPSRTDTNNGNPLCDALKSMEEGLKSNPHYPFLGI
jgi:hypothetical protein